jgi:hypothetical protein
MVPTESGEYPYFCTLHPFLTGTLKVVSSQVKGLPISPANTITTGKDNAAMEPINIFLNDAIEDLEKGDVQRHFYI